MRHIQSDMEGMSCITSSWQYIELLDLAVMIKINALQSCEGDVLLLI